VRVPFRPQAVLDLLAAALAAAAGATSDVVRTIEHELLPHPAAPTPPPAPPPVERPVEPPPSPPTTGPAEPVLPPPVTRPRAPRARPRRRRIELIVSDDLDGSQPARCVHFAIDGRGYEIDLNAGHEAQLRAALEPYVAHARNTFTPAQLRGPRTEKEDLVAVRAWAARHGYDEVTSRGPIPRYVLAAYRRAHRR